MRRPYGKYIMNYWDNLPRDLQNKILGFVATTIQKNWRGSFASPAKQSLKFAKELLIEINQETSPWLDQWKYIDTMSPRTALIVGYCAKYADYLIGGNIWSDFMKTIKYDLWLNEFTGGPGALYYGEIEIKLPILKTRLSRQIWSI